MKRSCLALLTALLVVSAPFAAAAAETFTGTISDDMCGASHASMRMGPTDADCTKACVDAHGASYVLHDGKTAYKLSDQKRAAQFAGKKVKVTGTLDAKTKTIKVESIN